MDYSFGSWIKRRRKALDLSQQDLANKVGCSTSAIFKIESDDRRPSRQIAELLAEHLQIPPEQRPQFLKVARMEKMVEILEPLPVPIEPLKQLIPPQPDSNLPYSLPPLIGREHELKLVVYQLREPYCRVLTLTGLGGVGKTRLALEAAVQLRETFSGGVFFVPLAGISDPDFILPTIANVLGILFSGSGNESVQLLDYLREKEILLVLDNFEHLLPGVDLLVGILQGAHRVKFLVTSREPLNLQAEWAFEVQGLPVPSDHVDDDLKASSATLLFIQRARQARLGFDVAPEERTAVLRICQLVEGLPLGIELAAAWVRALSCKQIALEIERNLDFLRTTTRDLPERHRSLRAVLDSSWELLSEQEKYVFQRLSVFRGGFRWEAAQVVAEASLEDIVSLLNKSILKRVGDERLDLHELVRQYAAERLESDPKEFEQARERYGHFYAELMEGWQRQLRGPKQTEILEETAKEIDNVRLAWIWMVTHHQFADILKSRHCLWHFHEIWGRLQEGEALFGQAIEVLQSTDRVKDEPEAERYRVLGILLAQHAYFCTHLGRYEEASELLQSSLAVLSSTADRNALAETLTYLAYLQYRKGEYLQASHTGQESLDLNRELGNPVGTVSCLVTLSYIHLALGEYEQAYALSKESLTIARDLLGDPHGTADSLITLSRAAMKMGQFDQAGRWAQEGLEISRATNDRWGVGQALRQLGLINFVLGDAQKAVNLLEQSISQFRDVGDRPLMARTMIHQGEVLRAAGSPHEAQQALIEALRIAVETHTLAIVWQALVEIAECEIELGRPGRALELVTFILKNINTIPESRERARRLKVNLAAMLSKGEIEAVQTRAQDRTVEDYTRDYLSANAIVA